jgi:cell division protein ZapA (FtsZ GTPase activity inhibitor)
MVGGQRIVLRSDRDEAYLMALALEVNACIESVRRSSPTTGLPQVMALVAMQLAERALTAEQTERLRYRAVEQTTQRLESLLGELDDHGELT